MNHTIEISLHVLLGIAIIALLLEGLGLKIYFKEIKEKPHIRLLSLVSIMVMGGFLLMDLLNNKRLQKRPDQFITHMASIFLMINTISAIIIGKKTLKNAQTGQMYFLMLAALVFSITNVATSDLLVRFVVSIAWLTVMTTMILESIDVRLRAEVGLKMSLSIMAMMILFMIGIGLIQISYGEMDLIKIAQKSATSEMLGISGLLFITASLLVLAGIPPFHFGQIDASDSGNIAISFLLLGNGAIQCGTNLNGITKILSSPGPLFEKGTILIIVALTTAYLLLWFRASDQSRIKRTITYIAASLGPIFALSLSFGASELTPRLIYLLMAYVFLSLSLFILYFSLLFLSPMDRYEPTWEDIAGLGRNMRVAGLSLLISLASLSGIPGTLGFFIKLSLIAQLQKSFWLNLLIFLSIIIGTVSTMRIFVFLFSKESRIPHRAENLQPAPAILVLGSLLLIFFGFFPFVR